VVEAAADALTNCWHLAAPEAAELMVELLADAGYVIVPAVELLDPDDSETCPCPSCVHYREVNAVLAAAAPSTPAPETER